jgi:hypothetical protein
MVASIVERIVALVSWLVHNLGTAIIIVVAIAFGILVIGALF